MEQKTDQHYCTSESLWNFNCTFFPVNALSQGEDVNQVLSQGRRPLHIAADYGQADVIKKLTENGADVNVSWFTSNESSLMTLLRFGSRKRFKI